MRRYFWKLAPSSVLMRTLLSNSGSVNTIIWEERQRQTHTHTHTVVTVRSQAVFEGYFRAARCKDGEISRGMLGQKAMSTDWVFCLFADIRLLPWQTGPLLLLKINLVNLTQNAIALRNLLCTPELDGFSFIALQPK